MTFSYTAFYDNARNACKYLIFLSFFPFFHHPFFASYPPHRSLSLSLSPPLYNYSLVPPSFHPSFFRVLCALRCEHTWEIARQGGNRWCNRESNKRIVSTKRIERCLIYQWKEKYTFTLKKYDNIEEEEEEEEEEEDRLTVWGSDLT